MTDPVLWLGLGQLGSALARRLARAGRTLVGVDPAVSSQQPFVIHRSLAEVASRYPIMAACLPTPGDLLDAVRWAADRTGDNRPHLLINLSTIGPEAAQEASELAQSAEIAYLEAPVSGGVLRARRGRISIFWGSDAPEEQVQPAAALLPVLARTVIHVGSVADASKVKLINNLLAVANSFAVLEGLRLAVELGLDPYLTRELLEHGTANSYVLRSTVKRPMTTPDHVTGFATRLARKDMLLLRTALAGTDSALLDELIERLDAAMAAGYADQVFPMAAIDDLLGPRSQTAEGH